MFRRELQSATAAAAGLGVLLSCGLAVADDDHGQKTATPIKHVIILIGENWTFDGMFATYQPKNNKQSVANLLSRGIVTASGDPGPHHAKSWQYQINQPYPATYFIDALQTAGKTLYEQGPATPSFPPPNTAYVPMAPGPLSQGQGPFDSSVPDSLLPTIEPSLEVSDLGLLRTGASGLSMFTTDTRVPNATKLPNGSFPSTSATRPYDSYVGDMVHRLFHMWQQSDCDVMNATADNPSGCLSDLYPFVGVARNDGSGSNSMAFLNVQKGDAPVFKRLADKYTLNDNYHQPIMGGTAVQHQMIGTADDVFWETFQGASAPPGASVANPNPKTTTDARSRPTRPGQTAPTSRSPELHRSWRISPVCRGIRRRTAMPATST